MYGIKDGYRENPGPVYFTDDVTQDRGIVFQPDVYALAEWAAGYDSDEDLRPSIVDVGCGRADKLAAMRARHPEWEYVGVDYGGNIAWCRENYDWGEWIDHDLEAEFSVETWTAPVIVCSDVIEHLVDPLPLLASLRKAGPAVVVLSTPERDVQYGPKHIGPSKNLCHVREWNAAELHDLLTGEGFNVRFHGLTRSSDQGWSMATQIVVCE